MIRLLNTSNAGSPRSFTETPKWPVNMPLLNRRYWMWKGLVQAKLLLHPVSIRSSYAGVGQVVNRDYP